jgi:hypothetical protein
MSTDSREWILGHTAVASVNIPTQKRPVITDDTNYAPHKQKRKGVQF